MDSDSQIQLDDIGIGEMMDVLSDMGYTITALSNEEVIDLYVAVMDGHAEEADETEELSFSDD